MILTIELPDHVAARLSRFAPEEIHDFAVTAIWEAVTAAESAPEALAEVIAAGKEALADIAAGRTLTLEEANANLPPRLAQAVTRYHEK